MTSLPDLDYDGSDRSGPSRSSSSSSLSLFPITEPADYCTPTLSKPEPPSNDQRHAVLMPKAHWKRDRDASVCDTFDCEIQFGILERRHHCRKCGGVFCQSCSTQTYPLLDTSNMPFYIPPAHLPLPLLAASSPTGGFTPSRVCDDCHATLSGQPAPSFLRIQAKAALRDSSIPDEDATKITSLEMALSPENHHFDEQAMQVGPMCRETYVKKPRHLRRSGSSRSATSNRRSSIPRSPLSESGVPRCFSPATMTSTPCTMNTPLPPPSNRAPSPYFPSSPLRRGSSTSTSSSSGQSIATSTNGLASYPLRQPSRQCKLNGGAFWEPKPMSRRIDPPVWYEAGKIEVVGEDEEELVGGQQVVRRRIRLTRDMWSAPFGLPEHALEPDRISTF